MKTLIAILMVSLMVVSALTAVSPVLFAATPSNDTAPNGLERLADNTEAEAGQAENNAEAEEAAADAAPLPGTRFMTVRVRIDPKGKPLAAYQFELTSTDASFKIVGVTGSPHLAFRRDRPPYFDPIVVNKKTDRLILADFAKPGLKADELPTASVLVAEVGVAFEDLPEDEKPQIKLTLTTAGDADGNTIDAELSHTLDDPERPE